MRINKLYYIYIFALLFFLGLIAGCEKEPQNIGLNIQPLDDKINIEYTDTVTVFAYSELQDSILTDNAYLNLLGSINDPIFGKTKASIYTQLQLSNNNVDFGSNPVLDSVIMSLDYNGFYGNLSNQQTVRVYEITESLHNDSAYYSNQNIPNDGLDLANYTFYPKPNDSLVIQAIACKSIYSVDSIKYAPQLRFRLDDSFGNKIIDKSGGTELSDNDNFLQFIKGLYVTVDQTNERGAVLYFDLESSVSKITLFYHNDDDTLSFDLVINNRCARFNNFDHYDYADADQLFKDQVLNNDTTKGKNLLYTQPLVGVRTKIYFPHIHELVKSGNIVINKAELVICNNSEASRVLKPPVKLALAKFNEEGKLKTITDQKIGEDYFGGIYNNDKKEYRFRLNQHIQELLSEDEPDYGLSLMVSGSVVNANRLIITGTNPDNPDLTARRMRLSIIYTRIN